MIQAKINSSRKKNKKRIVKIYFLNIKNIYNIKF